MYQEDAEALEHRRALLEGEDERRQHGTGMVDLKRDDWLPEEERKMSNVIVLKGTVPVYVTVDMEDKSVLQVVVDDEHLTYGHEVGDEGPPLFSKVEAKDENGLQATQAEVVEAFGFIEEVEWPAWQFGW